jgi:hypothetical protein
LSGGLSFGVNGENLLQGRIGENMNKKEFNLFKKHVAKWRQLLGCTDFQVSVDKDETSPDTACTTEYESQNRYALVTIDTETGNCSSKNLELVAIHEMLELLLADIRDALCVFYNEDVVDRHIHRAIRRLENALK